ncbi:MAG: type II toxin-antitoxin system prevent-host-death family antitoxin [Thalassospira sp.]|nr:type II toxin-antitoxin system prevent-host-death family antitoxin [Thalassospira sp.]|tara:strand:+ start:4695 stop:4943 length:249 start_codon:yes stop_codon:yes gene_type:complete
MDIKKIKLSEFFDRTESVIASISRGNAVEFSTESGDFVVLAKEDYDSITETLYLLSGDKNRKRLNESLLEAKDGLVKSIKLD